MRSTGWWERTGSGWRCCSSDSAPPSGKFGRYRSKARNRAEGSIRVAATSSIDPMHQFQISPLGGALDGSPFVFTNSALWMLVVLALIWLFMLGGMKRDLVPGRWQVAVEGVTGFVTSMLDTSVGPEGRKYVPWVFTIFMFILFANLLGLMPFAVLSPIVGASMQPFTVTSQFTITGVMAIISFSI